MHSNISDFVGFSKVYLVCGIMECVLKLLTTSNVCYKMGWIPSFCMLKFGQKILGAENYKTEIK